MTIWINFILLTKIDAIFTGTNVGLNMRKWFFRVTLIRPSIFRLNLARPCSVQSCLIPQMRISSWSERIPIRGIIFADRSQPWILSPEIPIQIAAERYLWLAMVRKSDGKSQPKCTGDSGSLSRLAKISLISLSEIAAKCNASPDGWAVFTANHRTTFISGVSMD